MAIYETHCHLNHVQFDQDIDQTVARAVEANVRRLLVVSYDQTSSRRALQLAMSHSNLRATVGIHPEDAAEWTPSFRAELIDIANANRDKIVALGEIGLDYHWKTFTPAVQKSVFLDQLTVSKELSLPTIIHCREAYDDTLDLLEQFGVDRVVLHCFAGTPEQAHRAISLGCYIGIGGVITYKNAANIREAASITPEDRLLVETDSPFLAPQQWRGKRNEPSYLPAIVSKLAETIGKTSEEVEDMTWKNAVTLFG